MEKEMFSIDDLREALDLGDYADEVSEYRDEDAYIGDMISEIADAGTSIYYSDIMEFISENPGALADVVAEGLYEVRSGIEYDLHKHGQAAQYMTIQREVSYRLRDYLMSANLDFIEFDLGMEEIPEELADLLDKWVDEADWDDRMNKIPNMIREYFKEDDDEETEES